VPYAYPPDDKDRAAFEAEVYPILARDCAFSECHGNEKRFYRLYRRNAGMRRVVDLNAELTMEEKDENFARSISMLAGGTDSEDIPLLCKPLETSQDGCGHKGLDANDRNVFSSKDDPRYQTILKWAETGVVNE